MLRETETVGQLQFILELLDQLPFITFSLHDNMTQWLDENYENREPSWTSMDRVQQAEDWIQWLREEITIQEKLRDNA
jgi:predicted AAA+ superfamily ATPase